MYNQLSVLGAITLGNTLTTSAPSAGGGCIKVVACSNSIEASVGFYNYNDMRGSAAGDVWVEGVNCWGLSGYSIGSPVLNSCLTISNNGNSNIPYDIKTHEIMVDRVKALSLEGLTLDDTVIIIGTTTTNANNITRGFTYEFSPVAIAQHTNTTLTYAHLRNGIIIGLNTLNGVTYTLPLGTSMGSNMAWLGDGTMSQYGQSFQWTVINMSATTGNINIAFSVGHSYVGNTVLNTTSSYRSLTIYTALNTAITYRICN